VLVIVPLASVYADGAVEKFIYNNIVLPFFGLFVKIGAGFLNYVINTFVINFGVFFVNSGIGIAIDATWVFVRDLMNLTFIFGLVYIGFKMILNSEDSQARRWLASLIIAAIFINFSLYFTKFVVDISNFVATEVLDAGVGQLLIQTETDSRDGYTTGIDLGSSMMQQMRLVTVTSGGTITNPQELITQNGGAVGFGYIIGTAILLSVAGFVFLSSALLFLGRTISLILYMIFSPLLFVGMIFPALESKAREHLKKFLSAAFFAPLYAALLYVNLALINAIVGPQGSINLGATLLQQQSNNATEFSTSIAIFILVCGLLLATLDVAKKLGIIGAESSLKAKNYLGKKMKQGAKNTARFTAAQTAGRAARLGSEYSGRAVGRGLRNLQQLQGNGLATRIVRGAARSNAAQGAIGGAATAMQGAKFGMKRTREEERKMQNQTNARADRGARANAAQAPAVTPTSDAGAIDARQQARRQQQGEVREMTNEEILELARQERERVMSPEFASLLSDAQVKALRDSGILTNNESDALERNRDTGTFDEITAVLDNQNATTEQLTEAMDALNRVMSTMSNDRLTDMMRFNAAGAIEGPLGNQVVASRLTSAQVDTMRQSGRASAAQMRQITDNRDSGLVTIAQYGSLADPTSPGGADAAFQDRQRRGMFRNPQDAGRLPVDVLAATSSQQYLTPRIIEEFLNNNPNNTDIGLVRANVANYIASGTAPAGIDQTWTNWSHRTVAGRRFGL